MKRGNAYGCGRRNKNAAKKSTKWLALAVITIIDLAMALALRLHDRREIIKAVRDDDKVQVLIEKSNASKKQ